MITAILGMPEDAMLFFFFSSNVRHKFREFLLYIYIGMRINQIEPQKGGKKWD